MTWRSRWTGGRTFGRGDLLVDVSPRWPPSYDGVGRRFSVDVGLRVDGENSSSVHLLQLVLQQVGFLGQRLVVPGQTQNLEDTRVRRQNRGSCPSTPEKLAPASATPPGCQGAWPLSNLHLTTFMWLLGPISPQLCVHMIHRAKRGSRIFLSDVSSIFNLGSASRTLPRVPGRQMGH